MDIITQRLIAIGNKLLAELRLLRMRLLRNGSEKLVGAVHDAKEAENQEQEQEPPILRAELQIPEAIQREQGKRDEHHYRLQKWQTCGTWFAFIAAAIYAGVAILQWREMIAATGAAQQAVEEARRNRGQAEKSLNATIEQFHLEQRAWVAVASIKLDPPTEGEPIVIRLSIANTGKIPAVITTAKYNIRINPTAIKDFPLVSYHPVPIGAVVTPGIPIVAECGGHKLIKAEVDAIKTGNAFLYIDGYFHYRDAFKVERTTGYCGLYNPKSGEFFQPPECNRRNYAN